MPRYTLVAFSLPMEGQEEACAKWYDTVHLPDMLNVPGVLSAQRYELQRAAPSRAYKRNMAIYEIEASDDEDARAMITRLNAANLPLAESLDVSTVVLGIYKATGPLQEKQEQPA